MLFRNMDLSIIIQEKELKIVASGEEEMGEMGAGSRDYYFLE